MGELVSEHRNVRQPGSERAWGDWIGYIQVYVFQEFFAWTVEQMNTFVFIKDLNRICGDPVDEYDDDQAADRLEGRGRKTWLGRVRSFSPVGEPG